MKKTILQKGKYLLSAMLLLALFTPVLVSALPTEVSGNLTNVATEANLGAQTDLPALVGTIINAILGLLGVIFVVLIIYAGFTWMTAQGDSGKVDKAKDVLKAAIVGVIIIAAAYAITTFVIDAVNTASA